MNFNHKKKLKLMNKRLHYPNFRRKAKRQSRM